MRIYELLKRIQKGDKQSIVDIFLRFNNTIKKFSKKLRYEESETDLIIAFLEIIKKMDVRKFQMKSDGAVINYIYYCLINKCLDLYKKKKKEFQNTNFTKLNLDNVPDCKVKDIDSSFLISILLSSLPFIQREVIERKFIQGYSDKEIAICLGISRQAVNRAKNRGLKSLRKKLEEMD
ncbi:MAG: RNA polymerase sigma factor [Clostridia bacterium]|nr:RNA polymerase sigma factor [Clostridia bacterium]